MISVWVIMIAVTLNIAVYQLPHEMPLFLLMIPQFGFCRIIYILSQKCSLGECLPSFSLLPSEVTLFYLNEGPGRLGVPIHHGHSLVLAGGLPERGHFSRVWSEKKLPVLFETKKNLISAP